MAKKRKNKKAPNTDPKGWEPKLPDTLGGGYDGTIDDFLRKDSLTFQEQRGKTAAQAAKELGAEGDYQKLMKMKLPDVPRPVKSEAIKRKKAAPGAYYNRGQRQSTNIEDARDLGGPSPTLQHLKKMPKYEKSSSPNFLKHTITNKKGK